MHDRSWKAVFDEYRDDAISPRTGLTRRHWEAVADRMLAGAWLHADPSGALICPPGRHSRSGARSDGLEGFARTFLLAAFRISGNSGNASDELVGRYLRGLRSGPGVAPVAGQWPDLAETPQALVEAASIALALTLTKSWIWTRLDESEKDRLCDWMSPGLRTSPVDNNWHLFGLMIAGFFEAVGRSSEATRETASRSLARIEDWYQGDGWYSDGPGRAFDHYCGWALHFYPNMYAYLTDDRALVELYGARLRDFVSSYSLLFDANGGPMFYGRSLIYRFAAVAPLWVAELVGQSPLMPGATRRLASGALRYFLDGGALDTGVLSVGWFQGGDMPVQSYSGPASPYWAAKAFVGLLLPENSAAWTEVEQPAAIDVGDFARPLGQTGLLAQGTVDDGLVRIHNHGSDDHRGRVGAMHSDNPLYSLAAYSTRTSCSDTGPNGNAFGLMVGTRQTERGPIQPLGSGVGWAASRQKPGLPTRYADLILRHPRVLGRLPAVRRVGAAEVDFVTCCHGSWEVRVWCVRNAQGYQFRATGWPQPAGDDGAERPYLESAMKSVAGFEGANVQNSSSRGPFAPEVSLTALEGACHSERQMFVALARLSGVSADPRPPEVLVREGRILIRWAGGASHEVSFDTHPDEAPTVSVQGSDN